MTSTLEINEQQLLTKRLKQETTSDHDSVDQLVMGAEPFSNLARYEKFLRLQHRFHGAINHLYRDAALGEMVTGCGLARFLATICDSFVTPVLAF